MEKDYSKTQKRVARKVYQKKQYGNFKIMMKSVHKDIEKHNNKKQKSRKRVMVPDELEDWEELIKKNTANDKILILMKISITLCT